MSKNEKLYLCKFLFWLGLVFICAIITIIHAFFVGAHWFTVITDIGILYILCHGVAYFGEKFVNERNESHQRLKNIEDWLKPTTYNNEVYITIDKEKK